MHGLVAALPKRLAEWHEGRSALRMLVAALAAYITGTMIHLPGPYSAVITTLIVARPHSSGVLRASLERLTATILGAGLACVATFGRVVHLPELLLIAVALTPLALITAHNSAYRTAMIAVIIVLSAPADSGAPLHVAAVRMLGVCLGAVIGALTSVAVLPSRREVVVARAATKLLGAFAILLRNAIEAAAATGPGKEFESEQRRRARDRLEARARQGLRELGLLVRDRPDALPTAGLAAAMVKYTVQMHADIVFLKRELKTDETLSEQATHSLAKFSQAFEDVTGEVSTLLRGDAKTIDIQPLRHACGEAVGCLREARPGSEGARLMLRRLTEDLAGLIRSMDRALRSPANGKGNPPGNSITPTQPLRSTHQ
jgi:hypothetical protein